MLTEEELYGTTFLILLGSFVLDVIPRSTSMVLDSIVGRILLFTVPVIIGTFNKPLAVLSATVAGLFLDRSRDLQTTNNVSVKQLGQGKGGVVVQDLSPDYVSSVYRRLNLIPMMSPNEKFDFTPVQ